MDYYKELDEALKYIHAKHHNPKDNPESIHDYLKQRNTELDDKECEAIISKLQRDKYIEDYDAQSESHKINIEGYLFIQDGMYTERNRLSNLRLQQLETDRVQGWENSSRLVSWTKGLTYGTVALCLVGLAAILWDVYKFYHSCH